MSIPQLLLYSRDGCHLCDEARDEVLAMRSELPPFELRDVDIEADEGLHAAYLERIPVFEVAGEAVCELGLDRRALERALAAASALDSATGQIP